MRLLKRNENTGRRGGETRRKERDTNTNTHRDRQGIWEGIFETVKVHSISTEEAKKM